jgi:hypothetical protein
MFSSVSAVRLVVATIWIAIVLVTRGIWTATALPAEYPGAFNDWTISTGAISGRVNDAERPRVDLYGNEIENAVVDYRIDRRGDLFERHAPSTALPERKRPGT